MKTVQDVLEAHGLALPDDAMAQTMREAVRAGCGGGPAAAGALAVADNLARGAADRDVQHAFVNTLDYTLGCATKAGPDGEWRTRLTQADAELLEQGFGAWAANENRERAAEVTELLESGIGRSFVDPFVRAALELAAMNATAITVDEAARRTDQGVEQLNDQIKRRGLLAFDGRIPVFQFAEESKFVPHLGDVLPELIPNVHPVGVLHWFSEPNPDLVCEATAYDPVSPRTWLMSDLPVAPVKELARHVMHES